MRGPFNFALRGGKLHRVFEFNEAVLMEERFLKQKAKIQWLKEGDANLAYFHKAVKSRVCRSRMDTVTNSEGVIFDNNTVHDAFVTHYEMFLGHEGETSNFNYANLFNVRINDQDAQDMVREISNQEVKDAIFSIGDDKSPGPDGFTAAFFKEAWNIIANDVYLAVREFFRNGTLLKEINHTIIALLPKVKSPSRVNDYRPISCCNVLFKCISKIIANRIKHSLKTIISPNQSAFIPGRSITDNILLTQELMHNYHLERGTPRCAFKVDIQKAYDTVDWDFLRIILLGFGFHQKMVSWIMECVTSTSYSICVNGSLHGYFKGKRGLRQGDPLSPYLFTLVMEVLTLMLQRKVQQTDEFTYHRYCSKMELVNLCFADDLFLFAYGDVGSASIIKEALDEFKNASGLVPSLPKSTAYFCNVLNHVKLSILQILPFEEGKLPVKYLGVPLVSSRLMIRDCNELVDKVQLRIQDWKNKSLSIAGRLQLIHSILGSMHIYWASVFILPTRVLLNIEQLMRQFLWCHGSSGKGKSKVAWEIVCLPKHEGGLGIRRLECFNSALMASHIWKLLTLKESLWLKWIHEYKLKVRNFWDFPMRGNMSWGWRKILKLRLIIRKFIWSKIGNGRNTTLWFDTWDDFEPLVAQISPRDIARSGLSLQSKVQDVIHHGLWVWPQELLVKYPFLNNYNTPIRDDARDTLVWRNIHGNVKKFSVSQV
ncbi:putative RNA-directed DNA polymerase, eukaryota, reverse transcriptase zinc-binding domain protein [Tanacetum coccineum]|uniref:RNA-directed DNA polymerase, eukaryota, reverse transcriptase zinc-binding domain protein n=1 Tax=Tanacetum coccineum TaxID=301880 RepID=A0ABQ5EU08_9ASTR